MIRLPFSAATPLFLSFPLAIWIVPATAATPDTATPETTSDEGGAGAGLPPAIRAILETAAQRDGGAHFTDTVLIVMQAQPDLAPQVLAAAQAIRPEQAARLAEAARAAFATMRVTPGVEPTVPLALAEVPPPPDPTRAGDGHDDGWLKLGPWDGEAELGASLSTGDTDEQAVSVGLALGRNFSDVWELNFDLDYDYARRRGATSKERFFGANEFYYRRWRRAYVFSYLSFEYNRFGGFDYRTVQNLGGGYQVLAGPRHEWSVEGGPGARQTRFDETGALENEFVGRLSSRYSLLFNERVKLENRSTALAGTDRLTLENTVALNARLNSAFTARLSFYVQYDDEVPEGSTNTDTLTKATIVYDF